METLAGICVALFFVGIILIVVHKLSKRDKDKEYYYDNVYIPFYFDEVDKPLEYFKFVYGDDFEENESCEKWKKAGKKKIKRNATKEWERKKEWDKLNKK